MIPVGRRVWRRRAHRHRVQRRRRARQEMARAAAVGRGRAQHDLRLFPEGARRGLSARALRLPDQQHGAGSSRARTSRAARSTARSRPSSVLRTSRSGPMARSTSPTGSIRASAATTTRTTRLRGLSTASRRRASSPRAGVRSRDARRADHGAAQSGRERARAGFMRLAARGAAAIPAVEALLDDENPYMRARAVWLLARLGAERARARRSAARGRRPDDARRGVSRAAAGRVSALPMSPRARARRLRRGAARSRAVAARCAVRSVARYPAHARARVRRQGPQLSRSLGHRRDAQGRRALCRARRHAARQRCRASGRPAMPISSWRLTPRAAVPAFAARASATSLPATERTKAITALGFIPTREAANALLDIAQHGGTDLKQNPALWWLINYKDSRWADAGIDAELKRRGLFDPGRRDDQRSHGAGAAGEIHAARGRRHRETARRCEARRGRGRRLPHVPSHQGAGRGLRARARRLREPADAGRRHHRDRQSSNDIAHGYEGTEITLIDGRKIHGLVLSGGNPLHRAEHRRRHADDSRRAQVKERKRLGRSLMLSAEQLGLTAQQVADIVGVPQIDGKRPH